jgi:hypothetical protein
MVIHKPRAEWISEAQFARRRKIRAELDEDRREYWARSKDGWAL